MYIPYEKPFIFHQFRYRSNNGDNFTVSQPFLGLLTNNFILHRLTAGVSNN
jgi:hypothetical protein